MLDNLSRSDIICGERTEPTFQVWMTLCQSWKYSAGLVASVEINNHDNDGSSSEMRKNRCVICLTKWKGVGGWDCDRVDDNRVWIIAWKWVMWRNTKCVEMDCEWWDSSRLNAVKWKNEKRNDTKLKQRLRCKFIQITVAVERCKVN